MPSPELNQPFARQVILPHVGAEGQQKLGSATLFLAGEGTAFQSAATALASVGVSRILALNPEGFDPSSLVSPHPDFKAEALPPSPSVLPAAALYLVVTEKDGFRRQMSRRLRRDSLPSLFGWCAGSGYALFLTRHHGGCPCLECFEVLNPKAFSRGTKDVQRLLGAVAASEALQWILKEESPILNKVWLTSLEGGLSLHHDVLPTYKCPARLTEEGAEITP